MSEDPRPDPPGPSSPRAPPGRGAQRLRALEEAVAGTVLGQEEAIRETVAALLAGGHALLEGAPGWGRPSSSGRSPPPRTLDSGGSSSRPTSCPRTSRDEVLADREGDASSSAPGPLFGNVVLADEVNRATPRTQSALLEAMEERGVSVGGRAPSPSPTPFCVLATQNPIEMEGTFPLPEAQLDRFLLKVARPCPVEAALVTILGRTDLPEPAPPRPGAAPRRTCAR